MSSTMIADVLELQPFSISSVSPKPTPEITNHASQNHSPIKTSTTPETTPTNPPDTTPSLSNLQLTLTILQPCAINFFGSFSSGIITVGLPHIASTAPSALAAKADEEIFERFPLLRDQPEITPRCKTENAKAVQDEDMTPYRLFRFMVPPKYIHKRNFAVAGAMLSFGQPISAQLQALWITSYFEDSLAVPLIDHQVEYSAELFSRFGRWRPRVWIIWLYFFREANIWIWHTI